MKSLRSSIVLSRAGARSLDEGASAVLGIPSLLLMENAGAGLAEEVRVRRGENRNGGATVFLCGPGNNGGDGYSAARRLLDRRHPLLVFSLGEPTDPSSDPGRNRGFLERAGVLVRPCTVGPELSRILSRSALVVDALFGTGLRRPLDGPAREIVEALNACGRPVVAADLPSGLDADTGEVLGIAVRASSTVSFAAPKRGLLLGAGPAHSGRVVIGDLGLPPLFVARYLEPIEGAPRGGRARDQRISTEVPESGTSS